MRNKTADNEGRIYFKKMQFTTEAMASLQLTHF
jgi:hypothetical protein